ncbi:MAG TPA: hypothetical protein PKG95_15020, partial [Anaerolineaceae bacterium]|nr:hypothetical protein [Anaerolineaceae bacterium]
MNIPPSKFYRFMLNLSIAMRSSYASLTLLLILLAISGPGFQSPTGPIITAPLPGAALQGLVSVTGTTALDGFSSAEVSYGYEGDQTGT